MKPIHECLLKILTSLPLYGTFNQDKPFKRLHDLVKSGNLVNPIFYSYNFSSTTDRLPILFKEQIITILFCGEFAEK